MCHLIHQTRVRRLVRPPSQQPRAMPEAVTRDLIIEHFDDEFAPVRFSLGSALSHRLRSPGALPVKPVLQ
jgi:hypothetical protein